MRTIRSGKLIDERRPHRRAPRHVGNHPRWRHYQFSTELLAASYHQQSLAVGDDSLKRALALAWQAATNSPQFGFAWARVAELEFSFGHTASALDALNKSLKLSPRNAQALALNGFLLAAQNKTREAIGSFNQAIAVDSALGNAWLGRGLCKIRLMPEFFSLRDPTRFNLRYESAGPTVGCLTCFSTRFFC